ncbi:conserved hypothetical protein [Paraburkholderia unamae]|uniref:DUF4258 domain-containing protein n=1 Tax=Paraburkholderia unamae TaxID=219649 RepID=UPI001CAAB949|nr:conserved hypothetical protein [Paraburkholderia unamae]
MTTNPAAAGLIVCGTSEALGRNGEANYAGVNEQAGTNAGSGGFDINVKGNTGLTGAVISSTADASKNSLNTGTLTFSDIQNQSHYDANSNGISAGVGWGSTGKATGSGSVSGQPGVSPMIGQNDSGDQSATTRSAISAGTINVTDGAHQTQDAASLSRDATDTNGTVAKTPDENNILNQQADTMQAAQAAGQVVAQGIGAYADKKETDALDAAKAAYKNGDLDGASAALADFDSWSEGGNSRTALHIAGGALIGGLGGGSAFSTIGGAAGAGLSSKLVDQMKAFSDSVSGATGSSLIGNLAGNIASGVAGAAVGGTAGAAGASNVNLYNAGHNKNDTEAKQEAQDMRDQLDKERAMVGQAGAKVPSDAQAATLPSTALAAGAAAAGKGVKDASTPVGISGSPMDVPRGTNAPATIGGVDYSAHAIDQMQGRGVPPSVVKNTIESGVNYPTRPGTTGYYVPVNNVRVVTNSKTGLVVTVIPGAP